MSQQESQVKTYKSMGDFQRDQPAMAAQGWTVTSTMSHQPRQGLGRIVLLGFVFAAIFRPKPQIVVTYTRILQPGQQPQPARPPTLKEQIEINKQKRKDRFGF